jgi:hypothetical protein
MAMNDYVSCAMTSFRVTGTMLLVTTTALVAACAAGSQTDASGGKCPGYAAPPAAGTTISLPPTSSTVAEKVLPLGCMHLISNRWTDPMATETLFLNTDSSFGWSWDRGNTGTIGPNYPELEFGVNPWGESENGDLTPISTTDLLPAQVQDIHSASMTVSVDTSIAQIGVAWNLAFEMWLSPDDPTKGVTNPKFEIMVWLGNDSTYWPTSPICDASATSYDCGMQMTDGNNSYTLWYASEDWGTSPMYTYIQFRDSANASNDQFTGTLDIYKILQVVNPPGNLYVTRFELGDETSQGDQGMTTIKNISFEVNGTTEAALMKY